MKVKKILFVLSLLVYSCYAQTKIPTPDSAKAWYNMPLATEVDSLDKIMFRDMSVPKSYTIKFADLFRPYDEFDLLDSNNTWTNYNTFDSLISFNDSVYFNSLTWFDSTTYFRDISQFDSSVYNNDSVYFNSDVVFDIGSKSVFRDTVVFDGLSDLSYYSKSNYIVGSEILLPALWSSTLDRSFGTNGGLMLFNYATASTDTMVSRRYLRATTDLNSDFARKSIANTFTALNTFSANIDMDGSNIYGAVEIDSELFDALDGYQIGGTAPSGQYLRGNGTEAVFSSILDSDLPATVPLLSSNNTWTGTNTFSNTVTINSLMGFGASGRLAGLDQSSLLYSYELAFITGTNLIATYGNSSLDTLATRDFVRDNSTYLLSRVNNWTDVNTFSDSVYFEFPTLFSSQITATAGLDMDGSNINSVGSISGEVSDMLDGYQVNGSAPSGQYLRGNGSEAVFSSIQLADLPSGVGLLGSNNTWTGTNTFTNTTTISGNLGFSSTGRLVSLNQSSTLNQYELTFLTGTNLIETYGFSQADTLATYSYLRSNYPSLSGNNTWSGSNTFTANVDLDGNNLNSVGEISSELVDALDGYQVGGSAPSGQYLRGNGTEGVFSAIQLSDLPSGIAKTGSANTFTSTNTFSGTVTINSNLGFGSSGRLVGLDHTGTLFQYELTFLTGTDLIETYGASGVDTLATYDYLRNSDVAMKSYANIFSEENTFTGGIDMDASNINSIGTASGEFFEASDEIYTDYLRPYTASAVFLDVKSKSTGGGGFRILDANDVKYGTVYGSAPTAQQFGFLDKDDHWSYKHVSDDRHEWSINNVEHMQLDEDGLFINNSLAFENNDVTSGATIDVSDKTFIQLDYGSSTTVTNFTNGIVGQVLYITRVGGNPVTIQDDGVNIHLAGSTNYLPTLNSSLTLIKSDNGWIELSRSVN